MDKINEFSKNANAADLSSEEKKRVGSFQRWIESFKELGQSFALLGNGFLNFLHQILIVIFLSAIILS